MLKIKKLRCLFNQILVTSEKYNENDFEGTLITKGVGTLKEIQKVIAVGPMVKGIEVGEYVYINPARYAQRKFKEGTLRDDNVQEMNHVTSYSFNTVVINDEEYIKLYDSDIEYVIEEMEEVENKVILPKKQKLLIPDKSIV